MVKALYSDSVRIVIWLGYWYRKRVVMNTCVVLFFQAEDGIRYLVRSRGLGDVYKRQALRSYKLG